MGFWHFSYMETQNFVLPDLTRAIIGASMEVANGLGGGFLEKVYERALVVELTERGIAFEQQVRFPVHFKGRLVGEYVADLVINGAVVVELKCVEHIGSDHVAQCLNYLKASGLVVGLILNFKRSRLDWKRLVGGGEG